MIETNMVATLVSQERRSKNLANAFFKDQIREIDQRIEHLNMEKSDLEKDIQDRNGLQELNYRFSKEKKELELLIYRLTHECEKFHQRLEELKNEELSLEKRIVRSAAKRKLVAMISFRTTSRRKILRRRTTKKNVVNWTKRCERCATNKRISIDF